MMFYRYFASKFISAPLFFANLYIIRPRGADVKSAVVVAAATHVLYLLRKIVLTKVCNISGESIKNYFGHVFDMIDKPDCSQLGGTMPPSFTFIIINNKK